MNTPPEIEELLQKVRSSQRLAWERGEQVFVETYLVQHPQLAAHKDSVFDFIYSEFCLRVDLGLKPDPNEYFQRFPQSITTLKRLFEVHEGLVDSPSTVNRHLNQASPPDTHVPLASICDEFKKSLESGVSKPVETLIEMVPAPMRERLVFELLRIDIEYRRQIGQSVSRDELLKRFPALPDVINQLLNPISKPGSSIQDEATADWMRRGNNADDSDSENQSNRRSPNDPSTQSISGRYEIISKHAEGGLGIVSLAIDHDFGRQVALKQIKQRVAEDPERRERFLWEAAITGQLEHPAIVPVYSLGSFADGNPYYVMRFIRGCSLKDSIKQFHRQGGPKATSKQLLALRELLGQFVTVCQAIGYAHSRGIVHRDLKPANILVGNFGETLVVDWGLAKQLNVEDSKDSVSHENTLLEKTPSAKSLSETLDGTVMGTLAFMSPEQAAGDLSAVGNPSDIYALGATLYAILTNYPPHIGPDPRSTISQICTGTMRRPREIVENIPRPLESICLKAMALKPADRYSTAIAVAEDVTHWLGDEAVQAHRDSLWERSLRFARRNRHYLLATIAALVVIAVVGTTAAIITQRAWHQEFLAHQTANDARLKEQKARQWAMTNYRTARRSVDRWLTGATESLRYYPGFQKIRGTLLQEAAADYELFARNETKDAELEIERGRAWLRLGDAEMSLGNTAKALRSFQEAEAVIGNLLADRNSPIESTSATVTPDSQTYRIDMISAKVRQGQAHFAQGELAATRKCFAEAAEIAEEISPETLADPETAGTISSLHLGRATLELESSQWNTARLALSKAAKSLSSISESESVNLSIVEPQLNLLRLQARVGIATGDYQTAEKHLRTAIEKAEQLLPSLTVEQVRVRDWSASLRIELGLVFKQSGKIQQEREEYLAAERHYIQLAQAIPDALIFKELLALARNDIAQVDLELDLLPEGQLAVDSAAVIFSQLVDTNAKATRYQEELAAAEELQARYLVEQNHSVDADPKMQAVLNRFDRLAQEVPESSDYIVRRALAQVLHAQILSQKKEIAAAETAFRSAIQGLRELTEAVPQSLLANQSLAQALTEYAAWLDDQDRKDDSSQQFAAATQAYNSGLMISETPELCHAYARAIAERTTVASAELPPAIELAKSALESAPSNPNYFWTYAWLLCLNDRAIDCRKIIAKEDPSLLTPRNQLLLALLSRLEGDSLPAKEHLENGERLANESRPGNLQLQRLIKRLKGQVAKAGEVNDAK